MLLLARGVESQELLPDNLIATSIPVYISSYEVSVDHRRRRPLRRR